MKNLLTLAGIEPATFQFVAQHLNHCATAVPTDYVMLFGKEIKDEIGATCCMCEEKKYAEEIRCETLSIEATLLFEG